MIDPKYDLLYKRYLREAILLDGPEKRIFKADCNNEYWGYPDKEGKSETTLWGIAPLLMGDVSMVDIEEEKIEKCRKYYPNMDIRVGDVRSLPYDDEAFDVVLDFSTLDHIELDSWGDAIEEYNRVLKPGGDIILAEWTVGIESCEKATVFFMNRDEFREMISKFFNISHEEIVIKDLYGELLLCRGKKIGNI